jgi:hypothetical protein
VRGVRSAPSPGPALVIRLSILVLQMCPRRSLRMHSYAGDVLIKSVVYETCSSLESTGGPVGRRGLLGDSVDGDEGSVESRAAE